jgi:hypothetical protein
MIWLTWRQFRAQTIGTAAILAALAVLLWFTGSDLAHLYATSGIATCRVNGAPDVNCATLVTRFTAKVPRIDGIIYAVGIGLLYAAPAVIGVFWGAPLVARELETHTHRLAWNQSVTRTRWLAVKLSSVGLAAIATAGLLTLMLTWWSAPADSAISRNPTHGIPIARIAPVLFDARGIAPIGYAALAFALGVSAGLLIRRSIPAMAATLAAFAGIQVAWPYWIRPHLIAPAVANVALNPANIDGIRGYATSMTVSAFPTYNPPGAWILSSQITDRAGHPYRFGLIRDCLGTNFRACQLSIGRLHLRQLITYQPASHFWSIQWYETAIFLAVALLLAGLCVLRVRRLRVG